MKPRILSLQKSSSPSTAFSLREVLSVWGPTAWRTAAVMQIENVKLSRRRNFFRINSELFWINRYMNTFTQLNIGLYLSISDTSDLKTDLEIFMGRQKIHKLLNVNSQPNYYESYFDSIDPLWLAINTFSIDYKFTFFYKYQNYYS